MIRSTSPIHAWSIGASCDAAALEPAADVRLGHGEAGAEQRDALRPSATSRSAVASPMWSIGTPMLGSDRVIDLVAGVGGDDHALGAARLEALGRVERHLGDAVPVARRVPSRR